MCDTPVFAHATLFSVSVSPHYSHRRAPFPSVSVFPHVLALAGAAVRAQPPSLSTTLQARVNGTTSAPSPVALQIIRHVVIPPPPPLHSDTSIVSRVLACRRVYAVYDIGNKWRVGLVVQYSPRSCSSQTRNHHRTQFRRDALAAAEALATVPGMGERSTSATDTVSEQQVMQWLCAVRGFLHFRRIIFLSSCVAVFVCASTPFSLLRLNCRRLKCLQRAERIAAWKKKKEEEAAAAAAAALLEQEVVDEETAQLADLLAGFA